QDLGQVVTHVPDLAMVLELAGCHLKAQVEELLTGVLQLLLQVGHGKPLEIFHLHFFPPPFAGLAGAAAAFGAAPGAALMVGAAPGAAFGPLAAGAAAAPAAVGAAMAPTIPSDLTGVLQLLLQVGHGKPLEIFHLHFFPPPFAGLAGAAAAFGAAPGAALMVGAAPGAAFGPLAAGAAAAPAAVGAAMAPTIP